MSLKNIVLILFFFTAQTQCAQESSAREVFIVVPGTWSAKSTWYKPKGQFFESLKKSAQDLGALVVTFTWSGKNSHDARVKAAQQLAQLITRYDRVNLITHSHGSNVGILASQMLAKQGSQFKIDNFFALATPVLREEYLPHMNIVKNFFNFFSLADKVQTVFGIFERVFPSHERVANIRVTINNNAPTHSGIHDAALARWLPFFHQVMSPHLSTHFFIKPGIIHFAQNKPPRYEVDPVQPELISLEKEVYNLNVPDRHEGTTA